uniref:Uncharacterized protein n=1 Tax=Larimichthys crocea TaxID=215358 RepID=A0A0F8AD60_LARCR
MQVNRKKLNGAAKKQITYILSCFLPETLRVITSTCHMGSVRILRLILRLNLLLLLLHQQLLRRLPSTHHEGERCPPVGNLLQRQDAPVSTVDEFERHEMTEGQGVVRYENEDEYEEWVQFSE